MLPGMVEPAEQTVTPLREDVLLQRGAGQGDGSPSYLVCDTLANSYSQIGWREFEILTRWRLSNCGDIADAVNAETALTVTPEEVLAVQGFLKSAFLLRLDAAALMEVDAQAKAKRASMGDVLLASRILFPKFPLVHPQSFLKATYPLVSPFFSPLFWGGTGVVFIAALFMTVQQGAEFSASLPDLFSFEAAFAIGLTLLVAKLVHELAHAYSMIRHGVTVPVMGIALLFFMPVLFTETSDSWRLTDRRKRMQVAAAGMISELALAVYALLAWNFVGDGFLKTCLAMAATSLWVLTILINANPLIRFDGYFILSEWIGVDNLSTRATAFGKGKLRCLLIGLGSPDPEQLASRRDRRILLVYYFASLLYRVSLYLGLAAGAYYLAGPDVGLPVGALLLLVFLVRPTLTVLGGWLVEAIQEKSIMPILRTATVLAVLVGAAFVPFSIPVKAPSILTAGTLKGVYAPEDGYLTTLVAKVGATVVPNGILANLASPRLEIDRLVQTTRAASLQQVSHGRFGTPDTLVGARQTEREFYKALADLRFTEARARDLVVRAGVSGRVVEVAPDLERGQWVKRDQLIARLAVGDRPEAIAYVEERSLDAIAVGDVADFHLDGRITKPTKWRVVSISTRPEAQLDEPVLGSTYGGMIPTQTNADGQLVPLTPVYRVRLTPLDTEMKVHERTRHYGWMSLDGEQLSLVERVQRYASAGFKRLQIGL
ncbi:MAG: HlyD family efflux transporter periplasmic adaptor subunit [Pseudomonadota bacterium]